MKCNWDVYHQLVPHMSLPICFFRLIPHCHSAALQQSFSSNCGHRYKQWQSQWSTLAKGHANRLSVCSSPCWSSDWSEQMTWYDSSIGMLTHFTHHSLVCFRAMCRHGPRVQRSLWSQVSASNGFHFLRWSMLICVAGHENVPPKSNRSQHTLQSTLMDPRQWLSWHVVIINCRKSKVKTKGEMWRLYCHIAS